MLRAKRSRRTLKVKHYLKKRRATKKISKKRRATKKISRKTKVLKKRSQQTKSKKKYGLNVQFGGDDEKDYLRKDLVRFQNLKSVPEIETRKFYRLLKTVSTNFTNYIKTFFPPNPVIPIPTIIKEWLEQSKIFLKEYYYTYDKDGNEIYDDDGTLKSPCLDEVNLAKGASDKENKKVCEDLKEYRDRETDFYKSPIRALRVKISGILKYLSTTLPKSLGSPLGDLPVRKKTEVSAPDVSAPAVSAGPPPKNVIGTASAVLEPTTRVLTVDPPLKKEPEKPVVVDSDPVLPEELAPEKKSTIVDFSKTKLGTSLPVIESTLPPRETEPIESNPTLDAKKKPLEPTPPPEPTPTPLKKKPPRPPLPKPKPEPKPEPEPTTVTTVIPSTAARATVTRPETTVTSTTVTSTAPPTKSTVSTPPPPPPQRQAPAPPQRQAPAPAQRQAPAPPQRQAPAPAQRQAPAPAQTQPQKAQPQKTPAQNAPAQNAPAQNAPAQNAPQSSTQKAAQKKGPTQKKVKNPCDIPNSATWFMGANGILYPYMFDRAWTV